MTFVDIKDKINFDKNEIIQDKCDVSEDEHESDN